MDIDQLILRIVGLYYYDVHGTILSEERIVCIFSLMYAMIRVGRTALADAGAVCVFGIMALERRLEYSPLVFLRLLLAHPYSEALGTGYAVLFDTNRQQKRYRPEEASSDHQNAILRLEP